MYTRSVTCIPFADIVVQDGLDGMGLVPLRAHGQKADRLVDDDDVLILIEEGKSFWTMLGKRSFCRNHV